MAQPTTPDSSEEFEKHSSSISLTHRTDRSALTFLVQSFLRLLGPALFKPRKNLPPGSPRLTPPKKAQRRCQITERHIQSIYLYDLTAANTPSHNTNTNTNTNPTPPSPKKRIFYFAGGGWCMPPSPDHWKLLAELACRIPEASLTLVSYPLAPHSAGPHSFPAVQKLMAQLLREAAQAGERVVLAGDSAGGNIALALLVAALLQEEKEEKEKGGGDVRAHLPAAVLAVCPSVDLRRSNPAIGRLEARDPLLRVDFVKATAAGWCREWSAEDPRMSPLLAGAEVFEKLRDRGVGVHGVTAGYDILGPDAVLFREKCAEHGVRGRWLQWEKQMHCFPLTWSYGLKEGREGKDWMVDVLRSC